MGYFWVKWHMDALIFYHFSRKLTGSTFNAFEYFITILEKNKDFKLIFLNASESDIDYFCKIFENRYYLEDIDYRSNIICRDFCSIVKINQNLKRALILDYGTVSRLKPLLKCDKIIHICEKTEEPEYRLDNRLSNVISFGEMPFAHKDVEYRMKLAFKRFKKLNKVDEAIYINSPFCENYDFIGGLNLSKKPIILKAGSHLDNLFEKFDEYVYYHANKWFDPHPRLFLECAFYNKKISYYNPLGIKDGSYYRYNDLMRNGLSDRTLDENDEVVKHFI